MSDKLRPSPPHDRQACSGLLKKGYFFNKLIMVLSESLSPHPTPDALRASGYLSPLSNQFLVVYVPVHSTLLYFKLHTSIKAVQRFMSVSVGDWNYTQYIYRVFHIMVRIGGGSTKIVLGDRWIVYTKSRKQLLHRKYLLYETGCICVIYQSQPMSMGLVGLITNLNRS